MSARNLILPDTPQREPSPAVSVIVPVWNDAPRLRRCLEALKAQTLPPETFEILVVDNGSTDASAEVACSFEGVRLIREPQPGSYAARNAGLREVRGEFVAFTDADCLPEPDWLANLLAAAECHQGFGVIGGPVEIFRAGEEASEACLHYEQRFSMDQRAFIRNRRCATANWLSRTQAIRQLGGFDGTMYSGGDFELARRIVRAGMDVIYAPDAVVRHPARRSRAEIAAKTRRITGGLWAHTPLRPRFPALCAVHTLLLARRVFAAFRASGLNGTQRLALAGVILFAWGVALGELARLQWRGGPATCPDRAAAS